MPGRYEDDNEAKVFVGGLSKDTNRDELASAFRDYGEVKSAWVATNPPGFGFVVFEDRRDAVDAIRALDGTTVCGCRVRVEHAGQRRRGGSGYRGGSDRRGGYSSSGSYSRNGNFGSGSRQNAGGSDGCYRCGESGHYSYDCPQSRSGGRRSGSRRSRSRSESPRY